MTTQIRALLAFSLCAAAAVPARAQEETAFPQEIAAPEATIVIYQPQPETLKGNVLAGRAAMSIVPKGKTEPIFGALWFTSVIDTDEEAGTVRVRDIKVTNARWPDSKEEDEKRFTEIVAEATTGITMTRERLSASLESAEREKKSLAELKSDPPALVFEKELAVLLLYDGQPVWSDVESSPYERALNTPYVVVREKRSKTCWLSSGKLWYTSKEPLSGWQPTTSPPADLVKMLPKDESDAPVPAKPPKVVTATEPTELVASDGEPRWKPVSAGELLYVENAETPWIREVASGQMYVLLSGRWFRAKAQSGPWAFVRPDQLPEAFRKIPPGSDISGVRVSVAGTEEAEDAVLDAEIPQTTAIKRSEAKYEAQYQGEPRFEPVPGTSVKNAVNTPGQILEVGGKYYAVDNGVWFGASSPQGPWAVADSVPEDEIQQIPPSSPVYNVTHVHVYQSTPDVVYMGYTPGYRWSFPYYGVPVYGTGWRYPAYPGYYFPRPSTFGFHVGYNPWTGWNFGMSWNVGFLHFGASWGGGWGGGWGRPGWGCCGGWYGGYRPGWGGGWGGGYRPGWGGGNNINIGSINIGNNVNYGNRTRIANNIRNSPKFDRSRFTRENIYNRPENRTRNADRAAVKQNLRQARAKRGAPNNVLTDKGGNLARKTQEGWQARDKGKWQNVDRDAVRQKAQQVDRSQIQQKAQQIDRSKVQERAQQIDRSKVQERARQVDRGQVQRDWQNRQRGASREKVQRQVRPPSRPQTRTTRPTSGRARR